MRPDETTEAPSGAVPKETTGAQAPPFPPRASTEIPATSAESAETYRPAQRFTRLQAARINAALAMFPANTFALVRSTFEHLGLAAPDASLLSAETVDVAVNLAGEEVFPLEAPQLGARAELRLQQGAMRSLAHALVRGVPLTEIAARESQPLSEVEQGTLSYGVARMLASLEPASWFLANESRMHARALGLVELSFSLTVFGQTHVARLVVDLGPRWEQTLLRAPSARAALPHSRHALSNLDALRSPEVLRRRLPALPIEFRIDLGLFVLSASELMRLRSGDVIFLERADAEVLPDDRVRGEAIEQRRHEVTASTCDAGVLLFEAQALGPKLYITHTHIDADGLHHAGALLAGPRSDSDTDPLAVRDSAAHHKAMSADLTEGESPPRAGSPLADLPIEVRIEVARVSMTLSELAELRPGQIVEVGKAVGTDVLLVAGDKTLGRACLVELDGELALQMRSVSAEH